MVWFVFKEDIKHSPLYSIYQNVAADLKTLKEKPEFQSTFEHFEIGLNQTLDELGEVFTTIGNDQNGQEQSDVAKPELNIPNDHSFSIYNIEIGDTREHVESQVGPPKRSTLNEYGVNWDAYHDQYHHFFMVAYDDKNKVAGLYTNQDLISSKQGISLNAPMEQVVAVLGQPETAIQKDWISYQIQNNGEFHLYKLDNSYVTIFFDKHEGNSVTAIQLISEDLEKQKPGYYAEGSQALKEGFEFQLFDLTNATRVEHGLLPLTWDDHVKITARDHSLDMAVNQYFDHTNLEGESPFDRMEEDQITFRAAGENLAAGQLSSIFAHEGLMNSIGHRENILQADFEALGIGVAFDENEKPFFTQNFVTR